MHAGTYIFMYVRVYGTRRSTLGNLGYVKLLGFLGWNLLFLNICFSKEKQY